MNKQFIQILSTAVLGLVLVGFNSCGSAGKNDRGVEYMPDMFHSVAYEANTYVDYSYNVWNDEGQRVFSREELSRPRKPVGGTIARGFAGAMAAKTLSERDAALAQMQGIGTNTVAIPVNGAVPYYYGDTEEERTRATAELQMNPFPITREGLARGKDLYNVNCGICHGEKIDGNGWLVAEENVNAKYPAQPAILNSDEFISASNGRYYHSIYYGKNVMGSYKDKLSYEERWQVIHYIRSLQAKEKGLQYDNKMNTLNDWAVPGGPDGKDLAENKLAQSAVAIFTADTSVEAPKDSMEARSANTLELKNVFFETGKATLKKESKEELDILALLLSTYPNVKIEVSGHTDSDGNDASNMSLSNSRAEAVRAYLEAAGVANDRMLAKGYGETLPVASNETDEGKAQNRRTEFTILSK